MDLIWKVHYSRGMWSGTLQNDPSVVVTADDGDKLAKFTLDLTLAILEGHGADALRAMRAAGAARSAASPLASGSGLGRPEIGAA